MKDAQMIEADLKEMKDLFVDGGAGLDETEVDRTCMVTQSIVNLLSVDTEDMIGNFEASYEAEVGTKLSYDKSGKPGIPSYKKGWHPRGANTLLRVLCYRADRKASKYLKKYFDTPKEVKK